MRYFKLWIWPGLAAVACLSALALWFETAPMETELRLRMLSALRQDHGWAQVGVAGRDISLTGLAPDEDNQKRAVSVARSVPGVRTVIDDSALLPEEKPYRLSAEKTASGITLSGFVPNDATRAAIISTLTGMLPGIGLSDQMKLARGAPADLVSLAGYGLAAFPRFSTGVMDITDSAMRISGQALNPDDHAAALAALASVPASAGSLSSVNITPASVSGAYSWSAALSGDAVVIGGYVPEEGVRKAIVERARSIADDVDVRDQMRFAAGAPAGVDWLAAAETGLVALENMTEGTVTITNTTLGVKGEARDASAFRRVDDLLSRDLPEGMVLGTADIGMAQANADAWTATFSDQKLELKGAVPSTAVRAKLLESAGLKFGTGQVKDSLTVSGESTDAFEDAALVALQALSRLDNAEVRIKDRVVSVRGSALNPASSAEVKRLLTDELPEGFSGQADISDEQEIGRDLTADACQTELNDLVRTNTVLFLSGEASIQDHSYGFLDRIARVAQRCNEVRLEVSGHTDADGAEAENLTLSKRRAEAVIDFMTAAGVDRNRLDAVGYGETRPLDSTGTDAAKAANRGIEFHVLN